MSSPATGEYDERLHVPLRWWVQGTMLVASIWIAFFVAVPPELAWTIGGVLFGLMAAVFVSYGSARLHLDPAWFQAGRARIETGYLGSAVALSAADSKRLAGVDADARAFLVLRPYLGRAVRIEIQDPADPAPYWLVATRHPESLVAAIRDLSSNQVG